MAINAPMEINNLLGSSQPKATSFADQYKATQHIVETNPNTNLVHKSFIDTASNILSYNMLGVQLGYWILLFVIGVVVIWFAWRKITKMQTHHDTQLLGKAKNYIDKAGDLERRTMPFSLMVILLFLLFIEASGFSYVFSDLMLNDASANMLQKAMIFGGFVVSIVLIFLTHFTGEEIHKMAVYKAIDDEVAITNKEKLLEEKEKFPWNKIRLETTEFDDDAKIVSIPQCNRLPQKAFNWTKFKTNRRYLITIFTTILILTIGIGAMFVRFYVFDKNVDHYQESQITTSKNYDVVTDFLKNRDTGKVKNTVNKNVVPSYFTQQNKLRDKYRRSSQIEAEKKASYVTYVVMMMLFFGIQVIGIISGIKYCFVGKESKKAYKIVKAYKAQK